MPLRAGHHLTLAAEEVASLFEREEVKDECRRILRLLAAQKDPRQPDALSGLIVDPLEYDAPGWFRVKVPRYAIRIVFRLLIARGNEPVIDIGTGELQEYDQGSIDIVHADYRKAAYGATLRRRYRRLRGASED
jgi:hypothetical protein